MVRETIMWYVKLLRRADEALMASLTPVSYTHLGIERHVRQILDVPEVDDHAAALRILLQRFKERVHLMVLAQLVACLLYTSRCV